MPMTMPNPDAESKTYFESVLPEDARVSVRPMFGNVAGFVNSNMFMGLFGNDLFVRLDDDDPTELLQQPGTGPSTRTPYITMSPRSVASWRTRPCFARRPLGTRSPASRRSRGPAG